MTTIIKFIVKSILMGPVWWFSYLVKPQIGCHIQTMILRFLGAKIEGLVWFEGVPIILGFKNLKIGRNVAIGHGAKFICFGPVSIGDFSMFGANLTINSASHAVESLMPIIGAIKIGKRVWGGLNVAICSDVSIDDDVVIGAGSVVLKSIGPRCVAVGVPCKTIRSLVRTEKSKVFNVFREVWGKS